MNLLITDKNIDDSIYKKNDYMDIEFYSPEPVKDMINLCDILDDKKYDYVSGS
jgi:hypothetical protein